MCTVEKNKAQRGMESWEEGHWGERRVRWYMAPGELAPFSTERSGTRRGPPLLGLAPC